MIHLKQSKLNHFSIACVTIDKPEKVEREDYCELCVTKSIIYNVNDIDNNEHEIHLDMCDIFSIV